MYTKLFRDGGAVAGACALLLGACGSSAAPAAPAVGAAAASPAVEQTSDYKMLNLVSDGAVPAAMIDPDLKNPWGLAFNPLGPAWIADNGTNLSTLYVALGLKFPLTVKIPAGQSGPANPTGIVYNGNLTEFMIDTGGALGPADFIFSGEGGTIAAWSQLSPATVDMQAVTMYDDGPGGAVYKGLALARNGTAHFLYATDFHNAKVDVFDHDFKKVATPGAFKDPALPAGYAPFGIQAVGGRLFVSFAQQQTPERHDEADGPGLGFVDVFDPAGRLLQRFAARGPLNAPWGIALAPADFGQFSNDVLIGNFGDGRINAFDPASGRFIDALRGADGKPLAVPGLWGLAFGASLTSLPNSLYFAAGINDEADGLYGRIAEAPHRAGR